MADFTALNQLVGSNQARRRATTTFGIQNANTNFGRASAQANQGLETNSLTEQYRQMRNKLPESYNQRGLLNSGLYHQGLQDYGSQRLNAFANLTQKYGQQIGKLNIDQYGYNTQYNNAIADVDEKDYLTRAQLAASLRSLA